MIDTHAHYVGLDSNPPTLRFGEAGFQEWAGNLDYIILAGTDLRDSQANIKLAVENPRIKACVGVHPEEVAKFSINQFSIFKKMINENRKNIAAIGECGLDAMVADGKQEIIDKQLEIFKMQIELAQEFGLPLVIHARKMNDEIIEILGKYSKQKGVFHCYTGGKKRVQKVLNLGEWYFGIDGNITYEVGLEEVVKAIPQERLVAETDCPYLTPIPFRGEENKPEYVKYVYTKIANIWGKSEKETEIILDANAKRLFML